MTDPNNESAPNTPNESASNEGESAKPRLSFRQQSDASEEPAKPSVPSFEELAETAAPSSTPAPPVKPKPRPAAQQPTVGVGHKAPSKQPSGITVDPSISFDDDSRSDGPNIAFVIVDAIAAAVAIAFTVLLAQDVLPFLK